MAPRVDACPPHPQADLQTRTRQVQRRIVRRLPSRRPLKVRHSITHYTPPPPSHRPPKVRHSITHYTPPPPFCWLPNSSRIQILFRTLKLQFLCLGFRRYLCVVAVEASLAATESAEGAGGPVSARRTATLILSLFTDAPKLLMDAMYDPLCVPPCRPW